MDNCSRNLEGGWSAQRKHRERGRLCTRPLRQGWIPAGGAGETGHSEGGQTAWARPGGPKKGMGGRRHKDRVVWSKVGMLGSTGPRTPDRGIDPGAPRPRVAGEGVQSAELSGADGSRATAVGGSGRSREIRWELIMQYRQERRGLGMGKDDQSSGQSAIKEEVSPGPVSSPS